MRMLAALAAAFVTLTGSAALAAAPQADGCTPASKPSVETRFDRHRLVHLKVSNPCRDRVVFVSWFLQGEATESDFDALVVDPGVQFDWKQRDLEHIAAASGLGLSGDQAVSGTDVVDYCWDTDGSIYRVTGAAVRAGDACPGG